MLNISIFYLNLNYIKLFFQLILNVKNIENSKLLSHFFLNIFVIPYEKKDQIHLILFGLSHL